MASFDCDVVIIGSGFGGSVAAFRAAEKGYRVGVMESGRRWKDDDIPGVDHLRRGAGSGDRKLRISVTRADDRLYAFDDLCTCGDAACPLSGGLLTGTTLMCECHG